MRSICSKCMLILVLAAASILVLVGCSSSRLTALEREVAELREKVNNLESKEPDMSDIPNQTAGLPDSASEASHAEPIAAPADAAAGDWLIVERNGLQVFYTGFDANGTSGPELKVRIYNGSETSWTVQIRDLSVNDMMTGHIFSCKVPPGKTANDEITIDGISAAQIQKIDFNFIFYNSDDMSPESKTGVVEINPYSPEPIVKVEPSSD